MPPQVWERIEGTLSLEINDLKGVGSNALAASWWELETGSKWSNFAYLNDFDNIWQQLFDMMNFKWFTAHSLKYNKQRKIINIKVSCLFKSSN